MKGANKENSKKVKQIKITSAFKRASTSKGSSELNVDFRTGTSLNCDCITFTGSNNDTATAKITTSSEITFPTSKQQKICHISRRDRPVGFPLWNLIDFEFEINNSFSISITGTGANSNSVCIDSTWTNTTVITSGSLSATATTTAKINVADGSSLAATDSPANDPIDITEIGQDFIRQNLKNFKFPKSKDGRSFQSHWMELFDWLEYSIVCDAAYCFPCRSFSVSKTTREDFTSTGSRNWSQALANKNGFQRHASTNAHINAMASWKSKIHADNTGKTVSTNLNEKVLEQRRYYTQSIIDVISFLCKHELAIRGNWDELSESETGLFNGFFEFTLTRDAKLRECERAMPPNITFKSPQIQNEIIEMLSIALTHQIVTEVNKAPFLTLMVDTKDKNGCEVISIALRYVLDGKPKETLIGLENCDELDAKALSKLVLESLHSYGIDKSKIIS